MAHALLVPIAPVAPGPVEAAAARGRPLREAAPLLFLLLFDVEVGRGWLRASCVGEMKEPPSHQATKRASERAGDQWLLARLARKPSRSRDLFASVV